MTATERPSELKACPFCGQSGNAKVWDGHDPITGMNRGVFCVCGASMRCGEESAESWNRRTLDAAPADPAPTDSVAIGSKSVGQADEIRCRSAKKHVERAMESIAAADRLDTITHLRAAMMVMEGHADVVRKLRAKASLARG